MTVRQVYNIALALMAESASDAGDYEEQVIPLVNLMLPELWEINNSIRLAKGEERLEAFAQVSALADVIPYEDIVLAGVLPYGLAAKLALDDDASKASYFNGEYAEKKRLYSKALWVPVESEGE